MATQDSPPSQQKGVRERLSVTAAGRFVKQVPPQSSPVTLAYAEDGLRSDRLDFPSTRPATSSEAQSTSR
jgi:hypothetical protein